jgi:hypothetical protein
LRVATRAENQQNRIHPNVRNKSGYRGVRRVRAGRWQAEVRLGGRTHYLGQFADKREAARAASAFRAEHMPFSTT